jgi:hypothetical protein
MVKFNKEVIFMIIEIDDKLKKYLKDKNISNLTIELAELKTC